MLGNDSLTYLREWILDKAQILAAIDVPIETFMPYTSTKTSILIMRKLEDGEVIDDYDIYVFVKLVDTTEEDKKLKTTI